MVKNNQIDYDYYKFNVQLFMTLFIGTSATFYAVRIADFTGKVFISGILGLLVIIWVCLLKYSYKLFHKEWEKIR